MPSSRTQLRACPAAQSVDRRNPESRLFIDGELVPAASGKTYDNVNPATEEVIGQAVNAGPEDMDRAIAAARCAFDESDWSTNHALRIKCIKQLQDGLKVAWAHMYPTQPPHEFVTRPVAEHPPVPIAAESRFARGCRRRLPS